MASKASQPKRKGTSTDSPTRKKKRHRRTKDEIARNWKCDYLGCNKAYGSEGALKMHKRLKHPDLQRKKQARQQREGSHIFNAGPFGGPRTAQYPDRRHGYLPFTQARMYSSPVAYPVPSHPGNTASYAMYGASHERYGQWEDHNKAHDPPFFLNTDVLSSDLKMAQKYSSELKKAQEELPPEQTNFDGSVVFLPMLMLNVGRWTKNSMFCGDMVARIDFNERIIYWEIYQTGTILRMELRFDDIGGLALDHVNADTTMLIVVINSPPTFSLCVVKEHEEAKFQICADFTEGEAVQNHFHVAHFTKTALKGPLAKLLAQEERLKALAQKGLEPLETLKPFKIPRRRGSLGLQEDGEFGDSPMLDRIDLASKKKTTTTAQST